jgi:hypothetical protein
MWIEKSMASQQDAFLVVRFRIHSYFELSFLWLGLLAMSVFC